MSLLQSPVMDIEHYCLNGTFGVCVYVCLFTLILRERRQGHITGSAHFHPGLRERVPGGPRPHRDCHPHTPLPPSAPDPIYPAWPGPAVPSQVSSYGQHLMAKSIVRSLPQLPALPVITGVSLTQVQILTVPFPIHVILSKLIFNPSKTKCSHL